MGILASISCSTENTLAAVGGEILAKTYIANVDYIPLVATADEQVFRLHVAVKDSPGMDVLKPADKLVGQHQHRLQRETIIAIAEQIVEGWSEKFERHDVVIAFLATPVYGWDSRPASEYSVHVDFILETPRVWAPDGF
jgi:hypothetical protein